MVSLMCYWPRLRKLRNLHRQNIQLTISLTHHFTISPLRNFAAPLMVVPSASRPDFHLSQSAKSEKSV